MCAKRWLVVLLVLGLMPGVAHGRVFEEYCTGFTWLPVKEKPGASVKGYILLMKRYGVSEWEQTHQLNGRLNTSIRCEALPFLTRAGRFQVAVVAFNDAGKSAESNTLSMIHYPLAQWIQGQDPDSQELHVTNLGSNFSSNNQPTLQTSAFEVDALVYTDRPFRVVALPDEYRGATYIQTPNSDKTSSGFPMLWFDLNRRARVCVARDTRLSVFPAWMLNFTRDGVATIKTTDTELIPFCQVFDAGRVELGGNEAGTIQSSNYVVVLP